jgi:hypothetical protein
VPLEAARGEPDDRGVEEQDASTKWQHPAECLRCAGNASRSLAQDNGCRIRSRRVGQELTDLMGEPVAAILPSQNALWTGKRVEHGRAPADERLVGGTCVHAGQFWCRGVQVSRQGAARRQGGFWPCGWLSAPPISKIV